jgi:uncharacterized membrane protein
MSDSILYTLITVGFFAAFYLFLILPLRRRSKRKGYGENFDLPKPKEWTNDPSDPLFQSNFQDATKKW